MKFKTLIIVFSIALLIECFANVYQILPMQFISKPSLMLVLLVYFQQNSKNLSSLRKWIIAALIFSWLGDVILLIEKQYKFLFVFGLLSFLIAHIFYVIYFWRVGKENLPKFRLKPFMTFCILFYMVLIYLLLLPQLSTLKIPVLIYSSIIALMLIASIHAFDFNRQHYGNICFAGVILFALSDSILAVNRFVYPFEVAGTAGTFVMLTYATGQLLITEGALRNLREIKFR